MTDREPSVAPTEKPLPLSTQERQDWQSHLFKRGLRISAVIHSALFFGLLISNLILPKKKPLTLQSSVRVDLIGLPDITKKEAADLTPEDLGEIGKKLEQVEEKADKALDKIKKELAKEEKEKKRSDEMALKKELKNKKQNMKKALERIKALQSLEESLNKGKGKKSAQIKGNIVSKGSSLTGEQGEFASQYGDAMRTKLQANWNLPIWLMKQKLNAQVYVLLDKRGNVVSMIFSRSSGNKQFDEYVRQTVTQSAPFGPPPADFIDNGVLLGFPL